MTSNNQRQSTADALIGGAFLGGLVGFVWGICLGLLVLGFQAYSYLRTGEWLELSALDCLKIVSFGTWSWLTYPRDWVGVHELLQNFPLSLFLVLLDLEAQHPGTLRANVIKVPHHGSETASTQDFINAVNSEFVIISASTRHHLPRSTVVNRYSNGQRVILRTDSDHQQNNDHIICAGSTTGQVECNYKSVLEGN